MIFGGRIAAAVAACLCLGLLVAACGGGSSSNATVAGSTTESAPSTEGSGSTAEGTTPSEPADSSGEKGEGKSKDSGGGSASEGGESKSGGGSGGESSGSASGGGSSQSGGGSGSQSSGGSESSGSGSKASLIRQGEAICKQARKEQVRGLSELAKEPGAGVSQQEAIERLTLKVAMPPVRKAVKGLGRLEPPAAAAAEFEAIVSGLDEAVSKVEDDPATLVEETQSPFAVPDRLAREFGFKVCARMA